MASNRKLPRCSTSFEEEDDCLLVKKIKYSNSEQLNELKQKCSHLVSQKAVYERLKMKPTEIINQEFAALESAVYAEKNRLAEFVLREIDLKSVTCLSLIEEYRDQCLSAIKINSSRTSNHDVDDIESTINSIIESTSYENVSTSVLKAASERANKLESEIEKKIQKLRSKTLLNQKFKFESKFKYSKSIDFGGITVMREDDVIVLDSDESSLELGTPKPPKRFIQVLGHVESVNTVCFDMTGQFIFTGSDDKFVKIWRSSDGILLYSLRGHQKAVSDIDVNLENTLLASGDQGGNLKVWDLKTAEPLHSIEIGRENKKIQIVKFSPYCIGNTRWLIAVQTDGTISFIKYYPSDDPNLKYSFDEPIRFKHDFKFNSIVRLTLSTSGCFAAFSTRTRMHVFNLNDSDPIQVVDMKEVKPEISCLSFANKSLDLLVGFKSGALKIWSPNDFRVMKPLTKNNLAKKCVDAVWSCDDRLIIASLKFPKKNRILVWANRRLKHQLNFRNRERVSLKPHPKNPRLLLATYDDGYLTIWDIESGMSLLAGFNTVNLEGRVGRICASRWSNNGNLFATSDNYGHLAIYGSGNNEDDYAQTPYELFIHHDFDKDPQYVNTKYGWLTNASKVPHAYEVQIRTPGRQYLTEDNFISCLKMVDNRAVVISGPENFIAAEDTVVPPLDEEQLRDIQTRLIAKAGQEKETICFP